jgi:8-oxo-dGTP pyrophosphatase MutT (NUDIX family)
MDYEAVAKALKEHQNLGYEKNALFSVLIPIIEINAIPHILFEVRSFDLESQPGEVCFPGGKMEKGEQPSQTALRETQEELNLSHEQLKIIGSLPPLTTPFHFTIFPFCGVIQHTTFEQIRYSKDEVDSIFTVPLPELMAQEPEEYVLRYDMNVDPSFPYHHIPNGERYEWKSGRYRVVFYYHQDHVIWGLTAKMLKFFLESIKDSV